MDHDLKAKRTRARLLAIQSDALRDALVDFVNEVEMQEVDPEMEHTVCVMEQFKNLKQLSLDLRRIADKLIEH